MTKKHKILLFKFVEDFHRYIISYERQCFFSAEIFDLQHENSFLYRIYRSCKSIAKT